MKKNELNIAIGQRIRQTRETMGYTRESFSELCDLSESFLSDVERGNKSITTKTLHKICKTSHISADYIVFGSDSNNKSSSPAMESIMATLTLLNEDQRIHAATILREYYIALSSTNR